MDMNKMAIEALERLKEVETGTVKVVPLIDLLMPLLEKMSDEELEQLYEELKTE
jgi:Ca2+-binding EF-hand superfamily protein